MLPDFRAIHAPFANQLLYDGLYLAICAGKNKAKLFYPSYVKTYLEKDVRGLLKIKDRMLFMKFMPTYYVL